MRSMCGVFMYGWPPALNSSKRRSSIRMTRMFGRTAMSLLRRLAQLLVNVLEQVERERETDGERQCARDREQALVPVAPREKLDREETQAAGHMRGEQHDEHDLA